MKYTDCVAFLDDCATLNTTDEGKPPSPMAIANAQWWVEHWPCLSLPDLMLNWEGHVILRGSDRDRNDLTIRAFVTGEIEYTLWTPEVAKVGREIGSRDIYEEGIVAAVDETLLARIRDWVGVKQ